MGTFEDLKAIWSDARVGDSAPGAQIGYCEIAHDGRLLLGAVCRGPDGTVVEPAASSGGPPLRLLDEAAQRALNTYLAFPDAPPPP